MTGLPPSLSRVIGLSGGALDVLMPMHVWADPDGRVVQAGPTLTKMARRGDLTGLPLFRILEFRRPARVDGVQALMALAGQRLGLALRDAPDLPLRGALTTLPEGTGLILDISLGLSFARAVAEFGLTLNDFSPCDQTVELLYLHEANTSTMALSRHLSRRLEAARAEAEAQALSDPLTGLANRRAMDAEIARCLDDPGQDFGLLHIDLDRFKQVNDTLGHAAGDAVLARVGAILRHQLRHTDVAGRVGGDEFLVLLRDCPDRAEMAAVAARLIAAIEEPVPFEGHLCRISASIGLAASIDYNQRPGLDRVLADTDAALYAAKRGGRGRYAAHGEPEPAPRRRAGDAAPGGFTRRCLDPLVSTPNTGGD
ncbi:GGDEF domain-containing protein [Roseicyclus mahoneyensis]|uniref:Diguanylate cyclase (GGDEF)-like protein n=1 Tax=Roseicyclus mahoneyensis TaxID=164332 RepID=A0A316GKY1_9RHOB|nr:GGDEF domain-containing protein [Roseicyclus mahoneyensis]PWK60668.1 diguanylate cyclase (GGDEF)-like protein [Roseicyclus mahoneyensis]